MTALTIVYFAWVREAIGRDEEQVDRPAAGARIADLVEMLAARGGASSWAGLRRRVGGTKGEDGWDVVGR